MHDPQLMLETAIQAARAAGRVLVERLPDKRQVRVKGLRDIVTDADLAAEQAIVEILRARFPDHALLTEETGTIAGDAPYVWVIDPLDGTTNYSRRLPTFSVSVGLTHHGQLALGVVYDPMLDQVFAAVRGQGATLDGDSMHVSAIENVRYATVGLDWAHAQPSRHEMVARVQHVAPACGTLRGLGSAALGLCYVAAGWLDAYFHIGLKAWDMAAGLLLVQEAGGHVSTLEGNPWQPWHARVLVSNGSLHQTLLDLMDDVKE